MTSGQQDGACVYATFHWLVAALCRFFSAQLDAKEVTVAYTAFAPGDQHLQEW